MVAGVAEAAPIASGSMLLETIHSPNEEATVVVVTIIIAIARFAGEPRTSRLPLALNETNERLAVHFEPAS